MIDLVLGYSQTNDSPLLKTLLGKIDQLKRRYQTISWLYRPCANRRTEVRSPRDPRRDASIS